jgi:hypothetical protein
MVVLVFFDEGRRNLGSVSKLAKRESVIRLGAEEAPEPLLDFFFTTMLVAIDWCVVGFETRRCLLEHRDEA